MSTGYTPIPSRLEWDGRTGLAVHDGVSCTLVHAPGPWAEVRFSGDLQAQVRDHPAHARRDMLPAERAQVERWLAYMAHAVRTAINQA